MPEDFYGGGRLACWFRRHGRSFDLALFAVTFVTVGLFAGQIIRVSL